MVLQIRLVSILNSLVTLAKISYAQYFILNTASLNEIMTSKCLLIRKRSIGFVENVGYEYIRCRLKKREILVLKPRNTNFWLWQITFFGGNLNKKLFNYSHYFIQVSLISTVLLVISFWPENSFIKMIEESDSFDISVMSSYPNCIKPLIILNYYCKRWIIYRPQISILFF